MNVEYALVVGFAFMLGGLFIGFFDFTQDRRQAMKRALNDERDRTALWKSRYDLLNDRLRDAQRKLQHRNDVIALETKNGEFLHNCIASLKKELEEAKQETKYAFEEAKRWRWGTMTPEEAIEALNTIDGDDEEMAHGLADAVVIELLPNEVLAAYENVKNRAGTWRYA